MLMGGQRIIDGTKEEREKEFKFYCKFNYLLHELNL